MLCVEVRDRLSHLRPSDDLVRFSFDGISSAIKGTEAYQVLISLALFSGSVSPSALQYVSGFADDTPKFQELLVRLSKLSLIGRDLSRVETLALTRIFAFGELSDSPRADDLRTRMVTYYTQLTANCGRWPTTELFAELYRRA